MTEKQFEEFAPLWGSEAGNYILVSVQPQSKDLRQCVIVDRLTKSAELIDDPVLALEVMQRMVDAGVEIVSELPE